ncbi:MAG: TOBE-like domain-containing protein [Candidatus Bathyarchaeia archaeon]
MKAAFSRSGRVVVHVRPEDIILSKGRVETSARNQFKGRVIAVEDLGPVVRLRVDAGRAFTAQITGRSFSEMGLKVGSEIYITFKASSVELIQRA